MMIMTTNCSHLCITFRFAGFRAFLERAAGVKLERVSWATGFSMFGALGEGLRSRARSAASTARNTLGLGFREYGSGHVRKYNNPN